MNHLPASIEEIRARGWKELDVVLVTGDAHVDHPSFPAALIGRHLEAHGFRVGVIARPEVNDPASVARLGRPRLFFGVTAGALDSMVANYTALKRKRSDDPYAPGGRSGGRPDRALTVYCNLIRRAFGKSAYIVGGGLEAGLRRFAHYDYWSDKVRRPILMDCGADILVFGMGEGPVLEIARRLDALLDHDSDLRLARAAGKACDTEKQTAVLTDIPGIVYRVPHNAPEPASGVALPSSEEVTADDRTHARAYGLFEKTLRERQWQVSGGMRVIANPPHPAPAQSDLDALYALPFTRDAHPMYKGARVPALEQVRFAVTSHRGCFGGCAFCAINAHQGKTVSSRTQESVLDEIDRITRHPEFHGTITDIGGPTANMYGLSCGRDEPCDRVSCLWPKRCRHLVTDQTPYVDLLAKAKNLPRVRHLFVTTGLRTDLAVLCDPLIRDVAAEYTSGHLKVAPEHINAHVLDVMRKPIAGDFLSFLEAHRRLSEKAGKKQFVLPYFMAAHPGCRMEDMAEVHHFLKRHRIKVEQCQIFTPTPGTASSVMYATGLDPATLKPVFVEKDLHLKKLQKALILHHLPENRPLIAEALRLCGKTRGN